jgi:hypothetical protein
MARLDKTERELDDFEKEVLMLFDNHHEHLTDLERRMAVVERIVLPRIINPEVKH